MTDSYVDGIDTVELLIQVETSPGSGTFAMDCLVNGSRAFNSTANATAAEVPNCTDPTKPAKTVRTIVSTDSKITGAGIMPQSLQKLWNDWKESGVSKNVKVLAGSLTGAMIATGPYVCTDCSITGSKKGDMVTVSVTLEQADAIVYTAHA